MEGFRAAGIRTFAAVLVVTAAEWLLPAAAQSGTVMGAVMDADGDTVCVANVAITDLRCGAVTDSLGRFRIPDVPPGRWAFRVFAPSLCGGAQDTLVVTGNTVTAVTLRLPCYSPDARAKPLPVRPGDFRRYPRGTFALRFSDSCIGLDTFRGRMSRTLDFVRDTTLDLELTPPEVDALYRLAVGIRLFEMQAPRVLRPERGFGVVSPEPETIHLTVRAGNTTRSLAWNAGSPRGYDSRDWKRLEEMARLVRQIVLSKPGIKALPPGPVRM